MERWGEKSRKYIILRKEMDTDGKDMERDSMKEGRE